MAQSNVVVSPPAQVVEEKKLTVGEVMAAAIEEADVDVEGLPQIANFIDPHGNMWAINKAAPMKAGLMVLVMFHEGQDVVVYAYPTQPRDANGNPLSFTRFTLSRYVPVSAMVEVMPLPTFQSQIAAALTRLYERTNDVSKADEDALEILEGALPHLEAGDEGARAYAKEISAFLADNDDELSTDDAAAPPPPPPPAPATA